MNEFRILIWNQFFENMKLNDLYKILPFKFYVHDVSWCDELTIAEIKAFLWMDDYELYPLKLKQIKTTIKSEGLFFFFIFFWKIYF